jgi:hypothetical protein
MNSFCNYKNDRMAVPPFLIELNVISEVEDNITLSFYHDITLCSLPKLLYFANITNIFWKKAIFAFGARPK